MFRPYAEILADFAKPIPKQCIGERTQGGRKIAYLPWYIVAEVLDAYAPGWVGEPTNIQILSQRVVVTYRLTIQTAEGIFTRVNTGTESDWDEEEMVVDQRTGEEKKAQHYGDPTSNAQRMAFKRAAADFGIGRDLYDKGGTLTVLRKHLRGDGSIGEPVAPTKGQRAQKPGGGPTEAHEIWHKQYVELLNACNERQLVAGRVIQWLQRSYGADTRSLTVAQLMDAVGKIRAWEFSEAQQAFLRKPIEANDAKKDWRMELSPLLEKLPADVRETYAKACINQKTSQQEGERMLSDAIDILESQKEAVGSHG